MAHSKHNVYEVQQINFASVLSSFTYLSVENTMKIVALKAALYTDKSFSTCCWWSPAQQTLFLASVCLLRAGSGASARPLTYPD